MTTGITVIFSGDSDQSEAYTLVRISSNNHDASDVDVTEPGVRGDDAEDGQ